jgi:hypothetical protein
MKRRDIVLFALLAIAVAIGFWYDATHHGLFSVTRGE